MRASYMRRWARPRIVVSGVAVVPLVLLTACGGGSNGNGGERMSHSRTTGKIFQAVKDLNENRDRVMNFETLGQAVAMTAAGKASAPAIAVIRGDVTAVESGVSNSWELTDDGADRTILPFGDAASQIDTYHLTVKVQETFAKNPNVVVPATVKIGVALPPGLDPEQVQADYEGLDDAVFFLEKSAVFRYRGDLLGIVLDGALVGVVENEKVSYPMVNAPASFATGATDLTSLRAAGQAR